MMSMYIFFPAILQDRKQNSCCKKGAWSGDSSLYDKYVNIVVFFLIQFQPIMCNYTQRTGFFV